MGLMRSFIVEVLRYIYLFIYILDKIHEFFGFGIGAIELGELVWFRQIRPRSRSSFRDQRHHKRRAPTTLTRSHFS